ncbi:tetratricopeptide (TPR) repeat protein [Povalibacter uvarum]|uniref:Tetratricopeptide (TPR) repeat protein n=1 Tax=Povalibacter uvarum TaxID=732238 RepID=A0A841HQK5_9GAMM|nr:tetratricopeptide repeat protein [Povalibacter uvarum]MBB6094388.1 tetratricopeptide (TPR) repeat protein [Povalibacter uvarum]
MTRVRSIAVALSVAIGMASTAAVLAPATVVAAEPAKPKMSKAVAVPLQAAQKAMAAKQWDAAMAEIKKAQAVPTRTPAEDYQIDEFLGYILVQQKKYAQAAPVFERMLNSGLVPADQVDDRTKAVAQMYFQEKEYRKSAEWAKKWLATHPGQEDMSVLLGQANYLLEDYKGAASVMSGVVTNAEKAGQTPKENYIQIVLSSQFKLDNKDGVAEALKKMVRYYPKPEYWDNLTDIYRRKQNSDRVTLGFYRLMSDVGILKDKGDYMEMSQLAIEAGVPGEAEQTMQKGIDNGTLKSDDKTEQGRYTRLLEAAKKQAAADRASLAQQAKDAEKATQGQASVGLGQAYLSYGMYDEAIAALQAGLKKGGVTDADEAQISLGLAQMKKGQKDAARQTFKAVKADSKWADLAGLWSIRTYQS